MADALPAELADMLARPPVFRLLGVADKLRGNHLNHVWKGLAGIPGSSEPGMPVVIKLLSKSTQLEIELACGLASQAMKLPVPKPALVICDKDDLPASPNLSSNPILLFGSLFQAPDPFLAKFIQDGGAAEEYVWKSICNDMVGSQGAVWDELVANPDRHVENIIFDGRKWWLFDHNRALEPINDLYKSVYGQSEKEVIINYVATVNQLLAQMQIRRPSDHGIQAEAERMRKNVLRLQLLAHGMRKWVVEDGTLKGVFQMVALIIDMIALRLHPLPMHVNKRLAAPSAKTLWGDDDE